MRVTVRARARVVIRLLVDGGYREVVIWRWLQGGGHREAWLKGEGGHAPARGWWLQGGGYREVVTGRVTCLLVDGGYREQVAGRWLQGGVTCLLVDGRAALCREVDEPALSDDRRGEVSEGEGEGVGEGEGEGGG